MTGLSGEQLFLLREAEAGRLATSGVRYFINNVEVEAHLGWLAADLLADGWLFLPAVSPRKYRPVAVSAKAVDLLLGLDVS